MLPLGAPDSAPKTLVFHSCQLSPAVVVDLAIRTLVSAIATLDPPVPPTPPLTLRWEELGEALGRVEEWGQELMSKRADIMRLGVLEEEVAATTARAKQAEAALAAALERAQVCVGGGVHSVSEPQGLWSAAAPALSGMVGNEV